MHELIRLFKHYGFIDILRLFRDIVLTKFFYASKVRLIRQPAYIIGKRFITFGKDFNAGPNLRIEVLDKSFLRHPIAGFEGNPELVIGDNVNVNFNVHIGVISSVRIGKNVLVGSNVLIIDHNHGNYKNDNQDTPYSVPKERKSSPENIVIEDSVWLGENVVVLPGAKIGSGCIVAANSVVTGIIEKNQIIAGTPARPVKKFDEDSARWISTD